MELKKIQICKSCLNPFEFAEELYIKHYSKLVVEINNPSMWASDTFRSIDPVYIHNYVIGAMLAEKFFTYLQSENSCNYEEWGDWLIDNIYKDGRKKSFKEKIRSFTYSNNYGSIGLLKKVGFFEIETFIEDGIECKR